MNPSDIGPDCNCFDPSNLPYNRLSFLSKLWSKPILEGFVKNLKIESIKVLTYPRQFALKGWFLANEHFFKFCFVLSEYATQSHNFTNWNFCDVTLLFSIYAFLHHAHIFSFFYLRLESVFRGFRCACTLIKDLNWFFFIPHGSPPQTEQAPCLNLLFVNSGFPSTSINLSPFTKDFRGGEQMNESKN